MNKFLLFAFLFFIGSLLGWCIELIFRKFFSKGNPQHRWINPGFLVGPYLPLYGSGLCVLYLLASIPINFIQNQILKDVVLFLIMAFAMTFIEYITGLVFIKKMHVKLWDYTDNWGNIQGIICPLFSFFWAVLGAIYYFLIHPHVLYALKWLSENLAFSFFIGMFYGVFILDLVYSLQLVTKLKQFADDYELVVRYEALKKTIMEYNENNNRKKFLFAFRSEVPLKEHAKRYLELYTAFGEDEIKERLERAAVNAEKRAKDAKKKAEDKKKEIMEKIEERSSK